MNGRGLTSVSMIRSSFLQSRGPAGPAGPTGPQGPKGDPGSLDNIPFYESTPANPGKASPGVSNRVARGDHVHKMPTAADVGARPDTWMPSAADVGALGVGAQAADSAKLGGIPASQYARANAVAEYEEGTWTPVLRGESGAGNITYSRQDGAYWIVGKIVFYQAYLTVSAVGTAPSGNLVLGNLPISAKGMSLAYPLAASISGPGALQFSIGSLGTSAARVKDAANSNVPASGLTPTNYAYVGYYYKA